MRNYQKKASEEMQKNEVKFGAILSYVLIILNSVYGLVIAPYLMSTIGTSEYGVYKTIGAMTASLSVLELGIGGTMQRYIAKFRALKDDKNISNFSAMGVIQAFIICLVIFCVGMCVFFTIDAGYENTFTVAELQRAKQIFVIQLGYIVLHVFENVFFGIISGYNKFVFTNTMKLLMVAGKISIYFIILPVFSNAITIVTVSLVLEAIIILLEYIYIKKKLSHKIHLYKWDKALFKESFAYTILLFIQSIIIQFNGNVDNIVIGAMIGTAAVTVYSFAIQIFNMYETCATAISGVVLPTITEQIYSGATSKELEKTVCKFGRVQWTFLGGALFAFVCFGKEFFSLWLGSEFNECWYLALILMIPVTFPLVVNVCLAILKAKNLLKFRTISMAYSVILNVILTVVGTKYWGYWAAAVGTAMSTIVGSIISMNIYYQKKLNINIFKLYVAISKRITICLIIASAIGFLLNYLISGSWIAFIVKAIIYIMVYGVLLLVYGLSKSEKQSILRFKRRDKK